MIERQQPPAARSQRGARTAPPVAVRGGSTLAVLIAVTTTALMAIVAQFALLPSQERIVDTLEALTAPIAGPPPASRPFGACGDICSAQHVCRHVVLRDGLHDGTRVSDALLAAAESCY